MRVRYAAVVAGLALGLMSGAAKAQLLHFDYKGSENITFDLDSQPTPSEFIAPDFFVITDAQDLEVNGQSISDYRLYFSPSTSPTYQFGLDGPGSSFDMGALGEQVFSGDVSNPKFAPGIFVFAHEDGGITPTTLTISAVPLPAAAPMFGAAVLGLAGLGYVAQRRKEAA